MLFSAVFLACYVAAMWWLHDRGRTPVYAILCKKSADVLHEISRVTGICAWNLDCAAFAAIQKRSLA